VRQRHVVWCLYLFGLFWIATIIAAYLVMDHLRQKHKPIPFVDPVIWRQPYTDGLPQLQPDI
jgi:hypothetical protein